MAKYKESGVEWLGAIPEDWSVTKLKYIADLLTAKPANSDDLFVGLENISSGDGKYISKEANIADSASVSFEKNDVLFGKLRPYLAKSWLATFSGVCSSEFLVLRTAKLHPKYLNYYSLTNEFIEQVNSSTYGSKMPRASWEFIGLLPIPTCSYSLSEKVAGFLDHETAKIDNLIAKQQQLIELLKEKRQAVISHAVTKGLNPDVTMKDSGVDWLGGVPKHWNVIKLKYLINTFEQGWSPQCEARLAEKNEYGVLKVGCVNSGCFEPLEHKALPSNLEPQKQYLVQKNDLLISRANTKELVGSSSVVDKDYDNLILCDKLYRLRFNKLANPHLISEFIRTPTVRKQIELSASGASHSMQNIGQDTIKELFVALPPDGEAQQLIVFIRDKISTFDSSIDLSHRQIIFLQERRTALISAAVTGKIDVRDWVAPNTQNVEEPQEATA